MIKENSIAINLYALHGECVWITINLLKGFIFPDDYRVETFEH